MDISKSIRDTDEFRRRRKFEHVVSLFAWGLDHYDVRGVCLNIRAEHFAEIRTLLARRGFEHPESVGPYERWIRR